MGMTYRPAVRAGEKLMIGVAGPSGSGKTYSALELATGIQEVDGGEIFVIDTENRRAAMYAGKFKFMHGELHAPFTPEAYLDGIETAVSQGAKIIVIDSATHEHEGEGGILEMHEAMVEKLAGQNATYGKREAVKFSAWIEPKRRHNKFVNRLLQINAHIIFCFRAKEKLLMTKVEKPGGGTKTDVSSAGWQPICADRLEYEMTTLLVLPPNAKGKPDLTASATKLPEPIAPLIKDGWQISRGLGVALAQWARGDGAVKTEPKKTEQNTNQARQESSQDGASDDGASQLPLSGDGAPDSGASSLPPPSGGASLIERYSRVLKGAKDVDDLGARHEGFEEFSSFNAAEKTTARELYKLNIRRFRGGLDDEEFNDELGLILQGELA